MNQKRYLLRGGIMGLGIFTALILFIWLASSINLFGYGAGIAYSILFINLPGVLLGILLNAGEAGYESLILGAVSYTIIGTITGLVYGKFKAR